AHPLCMRLRIFVFFLNDTVSTYIYPLSLHDALPILIQTLGTVAVSVPSTTILPAVGYCKPATKAAKVDLPAPDVPTNAVVVPALRVTETSESTCAPPGEA